jgi:hypothetical protein
MRKGKMMFDTVEELQNHYKAVRKRIEAKKPPAPKPQAIEPPKPLALPDNPILIHKTIQKYKIENFAFIKVEREGTDKLTYQQVVHIVCREFDLTPKLLFGRRRTRELVEIRHLCWAIARVMCPHLSLPQIGRASCGFDHTSVLHGISKAKDRAKPFIKALQSGELRVD